MIKIWTFRTEWDGRAALVKAEQNGTGRGASRHFWVLPPFILYLLFIRLSIYPAEFLVSC